MLELSEWPSNNSHWELRGDSRSLEVILFGALQEFPSPLIQCILSFAAPYTYVKVCDADQLRAVNIGITQCDNDIEAAIQTT
eukprot:UN16782